MANNIQGLKSAFITALTDNLDASTRTKLVARVITANQQEWDARVATGTTNNATNRGIFAVDKILDHLKQTYSEGSHRENLATLPATEILE